MPLTDAEKTRLLAEGVMGWAWDTSTRLWMAEEDGEMCNAEDEHWSPLTNESHAADVRERMRALGWWLQVLSSPTYDKVLYFKPGVNTGAERQSVIGAFARCLCETALLALGLAKEEEL